MKSKAKKSKVANKIAVLAQKDAAIARKRAKAAMAQAKVKFKAAEKAMDKKIQTHPEQAVLIAGAIGAAIGALATYEVLKSKGKKR